MGDGGVRSLLHDPPLDQRSRRCTLGQDIHRGRIYLVVYSNNAEQGSATDMVACLNESNSSISYWIQRLPLPTLTSNRTRPATQLYFCRLSQGWMSGWPPNSIKKITIEEFSAKSTGQPLIPHALRAFGGDSDQEVLQPCQQLHYGVIQNFWTLYHGESVEHRTERNGD